MPARRRQQEINRDLDREAKRLAERRKEADAIWSSDPLADRFWDRPCCDDGDGWNCDLHHNDGDEV